MSERITHALPWVSAASLVLACLVASPKKELWVDECYALQLAADPDTRHLLTALGSAVDGGLPPYYLLAHAWVRMFGPAVLGLRLLSALFFAAGIGLLWRPLARAYTAPPAALAVAAAVLGAPLVREQSVEIRFYGLYFLAAAAVVAAHACLSRRPSGGRLAATVAAHAVLVAAHPYGILYSGAAVAALAIGDRLAGRAWLTRAIVVILSWTILLPLAPVIRGIVDLAQPHNWPPVPTLATFTAGSIALLATGLLLAGSAATAAVVLARCQRLQRPPAVDPLLLLGVAWVAVLPLAAGTAAAFGLSMFVERYFLPSVIGATIILAWLGSWILPAATAAGVSRAIWPAAAAILAGVPVAAAAIWTPPRNYHELHAFLPRLIEDATGAPARLPILVEDANTFLPLDILAGDDSPYRYVLDWEAALRSVSRHATVQSKLMRNNAAVGYRRPRIIATSEALAADRFVVLDSPGIDWFERAVEPNGAFVVEKLLDLPTSDPAPAFIWLVRRMRSAAAE